MDGRPQNHGSKSRTRALAVPPLFILYYIITVPTGGLFSLLSAPCAHSDSRPAPRAPPARRPAPMQQQQQPWASGTAAPARVQRHTGGHRAAGIQSWAGR